MNLQWVPGQPEGRTSDEVHLSKCLLGCWKAQTPSEQSNHNSATANHCCHDSNIFQNTLTEADSQPWSLKSPEDL